MNRKTISSILVIVIVLLVGVPFFMYGDDGYSFPQALLMTVLIDVLCYLPNNIGVVKEAK